jgi:porin
LFCAVEAKAVDLFNGAASASASYTTDYIVPLAGGTSYSGNVLHNLLVSADADLKHVTGWSGKVYASVLVNGGGKANNAAGTLQGVDNIEVARAGARLFQFWAETDLGPIATRAGLYDLNSEFYSTESAGLFLAPAFGVGSELSSTGPNGPSIFPSTALAVRTRAAISDDLAFKFAVLDAKAGVLGDHGGVDFSFRQGLLFISQLDFDGFVRASVGAWHYSRKQRDIADPDVRKPAYGAYLSVERRLWGSEDSLLATTAFLRAGLSDGDTTPFNGGWQAGLLLNHVLPGRPNSMLSLGAYQGRLNLKQRDNLRADGLEVASSETGFELTASDQLTSWLRIQPDLQFIHNPSADRARNDAWVTALRLAATFD